jgi:ketol-acid reductoisomerase
MSWVRARQDGFEAAAPTVFIGRADVVVVLVPDDEQASVYWHAIEPLLARGALLVFARGVALATRVFEPCGHDVVLVTGELDGPRARCRVAVHHDATGHALERAIAYARAAFGDNAEVGTTTVSNEVDAELAALAEHAGGVDALVDSVEGLLARSRDNHAPEEAKVAFYEGLRDLLARHVAEGTGPIERGSGTSLGFRRASRRSGA